VKSSGARQAALRLRRSGRALLVFLLPDDTRSAAAFLPLTLWCSASMRSTTLDAPRRAGVDAAFMEPCAGGARPAALYDGDRSCVLAKGTRGVITARRKHPSRRRSASWSGGSDGARPPTCQGVFTSRILIMMPMERAVWEQVTRRSVP
jgi:hypothetical protein